MSTLEKFSGFVLVVTSFVSKYLNTSDEFVL